METRQPVLDGKQLHPSIEQASFNAVTLEELSIEQLQECFIERTLSSHDYVKHCLQRIQHTNKYVEAVIDVNPDAVEIATKLDQERIRGQARGVLHGIPVLVKDNIATKDRMQTTAGSWALLDSVVSADARVVSSLRAAGAIILGHTNMSEWASVRSKSSSTGYSPRGGQTRNPYDLSSSPYGSSSGSAVAVSANVVPLAFGTETDTSIIGPASINGVVGIKPTVGLTSRSGVVPISTNMDTVGSFGRTVADAVHGLNAIARLDPDDPATTVPERVEEADYTKFLSTRASLQGAKFGLPRKRCWDLVQQDRKETTLRLFKAMELAGATIVDTDFPCAEERIATDGSWDWEHGEAAKSEFTVIKVDAYNGINEYLSTLESSRVRSLEQVISYNDQNGGTEGGYPSQHPAFPSGQDNFHEVARTKGVQDSMYQAALKHIHSQTRENGIDAALQYTAPDGSLTQFDALILCDRKGAGQQLAAQAGYPIFCIPLDVDSAGMPFSLSLQHTAWTEGTLIKWASAIEDLISQGHARRQPQYKNLYSKNIPINNNETG